MHEITLFQHSDGRSSKFYCLYKHPITGKQVSFSCRTEDRDEAFRYASKRLPHIIRKAIEKKLGAASETSSSPALKSGTPLTPLTITEFAQTYVAQRRTRNGHPLKPKSRRALIDTFNQFVKRIGDKHLHAITEADCRSFILSGQPSDRTAQKHHANLKSALGQAVKDRNMAENYFLSFPAPVPQYTDEDIEARCFTEEDFERVFAHLPSKTFAQRRLRNMVMLCHETGLRLGELRHVKHNWINLDAFELRVKSDRVFSPKNSTSSRTVPLSDIAIQVIRDQFADNSVNEKETVRLSAYLFPNQAGKPLSEAGIENPFSKVAKRVLGDHHPTIHGLRHALVTRLSLAGMTDRQIQEITGHATLEMIQRYSHMGRRLVAPARDVLNRTANANQWRYTS